MDFLLSELDSNPNLDIIGLKVIDAESERPEGIRRDDFNNLPGGKLWLVLAYENIFNHATVIFKKEAYEQTGKVRFGIWRIWRLTFVG